MFARLKSKNRFVELVMFAMVLGVGCGWAIRVSAPSSYLTLANHINLVAQIFLRLVRMIIAPLVFSTLVVGIARMGGGAEIGRIFAKALGWFAGASVISLFLGLLMVNALRPGANFRDAPVGPGQPIELPMPSPSVEEFVVPLLPTSTSRPWPRTRFSKLSFSSRLLPVQ